MRVVVVVVGLVARGSSSYLLGSKGVPVQVIDFDQTVPSVFGLWLVDWAGCLGGGGRLSGSHKSVGGSEVGEKE